MNPQRPVSPAREEQLNVAEAAERRAALEALARSVSLPPPLPTGSVNLHMHSFFSYNAYGYSPSRLAWEARKAGLYAMGLCDFDVLDGLEEFLDAGVLLGMRAVVSLETRVYLKALGDEEISSPGEPGVTYIMGAGFARLPDAGTPEAMELEGYRARAQQRNRSLVERINRALPAMAIDYDRDVLSLTPSGNPTERHLVSAYVARAREAFGAADAAARFWASVLGRETAACRALLENPPAFEEAVRSRLVKRGGVGYVQPSPETFPPAERFTRWVRDCEAIPMTTWLDGTSSGERDPARLLDVMEDCGAAALNIIPDRNWNVKDPAERDLKRRNLSEIVRLAEARGLPISIGTEMNRLGQPFADDLNGEALRPYREVFLRGARILTGHSLLLRYARFSYVGGGAVECPDVGERNRFFEQVGALPPPTSEQAKALRDMGPEKALRWFREQVHAGHRTRSG